ncbi:hypothetical protein ACFLR4_04335 [Bacteroidota bacterium]
MAKYFRIIIFLVLVFNFGCGSDSPTDPGDNNNSNGPPIVTEAIGPNGGTITTENLELSIPANTLASSSEINVYQSTTGFSSTSVSDAYLITGVPQNFSGGFTVRLRYTGTINGSPYLAVGTDVFTTSANGFEKGYKLFAARDSSGYLCADIPVIGSQSESLLKNRNVMNDLPMEVEAIVTVETMSSGNHFKIIHPLDVLGSALSLAGYLEEAYTTFVQMGFDFQSQINWPLEVIVRDLGDEMYGQYRRRWSEWLEFNERKINDAAELRTTAGHEFFHIVQSKYDTRSWSSKIWDGNGPQYWLDEATAVWAESMFTAAFNYVSDARDGHEMAPFEGMQSGAAANPAHHGYGMSAMIKYLVDSYGPGIVKNIYDRIKAGSAPVAAISLAVPDQIDVWWPVFQSFYTLGLVTNDISTARLTSDVNTETFTISTPADTLRQFLTTSTDLSGSLFDFKLNNSAFDPFAMMNLTLNAPPYCTMMVYTYKGTTINYLGFSDTVFPLYGLKALKDEGWHILALVSNSKLVSPFNGSTPISLTAKVELPAIDLSSIKYVEIAVNAEIHLDSTAVGKGSSWQWEYIGFPSAEGSFNGNTFIADHECVELYGGTGTISVTVDPVNLAVTSFNATQEITDTQYGVIGTNVPFVYFTFSEAGTPNGLAFVTDLGAAACSSITNYYHNFNHEEVGFISDGFRCTEYSWVGVFLFWEKPEDY